MWFLKGGCTAGRSNKMIVDMSSSETGMRESDVCNTTSVATGMKPVEHRMLRLSL